jgi:hypothetical protein
LRYKRGLVFFHSVTFAIFGFQEEKVVKVSDAGMESSSSFGFLNAYVFKAEDVANKLSSDGVDKGAGC